MSQNENLGTQTSSASITDALVKEIIATRNPYLDVDNQEFFELFKDSLSLRPSDRKQVLEAIPRMEQFHFDEMIKLFYQERETNKDFAKKYPEDIKILLKKQKEYWVQLGQIILDEREALKNQKEMEEKQEQDSLEIEEIKKKLGI